VAVPLVLVTAYAYYFWYQMLVARGYGYVFNAGKYSGEFQQARLFLLIALVVGVLTFQLTRRSLAKSWRIGYVTVLGLGIALFAIHWIIVHFGPTPWWHHP
jgi:hypothetical protein